MNGVAGSEIKSRSQGKVEEEEEEEEEEEGQRETKKEKKGRKKGREREEGEILLKGNIGEGNQKYRLSQKELLDTMTK